MVRIGIGQIACTGIKIVARCCKETRRFNWVVLPVSQAPAGKIRPDGPMHPPHSVAGEDSADFDADFDEIKSKTLSPCVWGGKSGSISRLSSAVLHLGLDWQAASLRRFIGRYRVGGRHILISVLGQMVLGGWCMARRACQKKGEELSVQ